LCIIPLCGSEVITDGFVSLLVPPSLKATTVVPARPGQRLFNVYLPAGYDPARAEGYPVAYFLHGLGGDFQTYDGIIENFMNALLERGELLPMIIIKIDASEPNLPGDDGEHRLGGTWYVDSTYPDSGDFEQYIVSELIPYVDNTYHTIADRNYRGIFGQSMGGYGSLYLGLKHPELFVTMASDSGTPFWTFVTTLATSQIPPTIPDSGLPNPAYVAYNNPIGKFVLDVLPEAAANSGIITSGDSSSRGESDSAISYGHAFSPDPLQPTGAVFPFVTNIVGSDQVLPLVGGTYEMQVNNPVIALWEQKDPYKMLQDNVSDMQQSAKTQTIYLDGGDLEPQNAVGARILSDAFTSYNIDHEYLLYEGEHVSHLEGEFSRLATNIRRFSAQCGAIGKSLPDSRVRIIGMVDIELHDSAQWNIEAAAITNIATDPTLLAPIITTDVGISLFDSASMSINNGVFEIGNQRTKVQDVQYAGNSIAANLIINGPAATLQIGSQGMLGFAVGIEGKRLHEPNFWAVSGLFDVSTIHLNVLQGFFKHTHVASGTEEHAALFALGNVPLYHFELASQGAYCVGGGNTVSINDGYYMHPLTTSYYLPDYIPQDIESDYIYDIHPKKVVGQSYDTDGFIGVSQQSLYYVTDQLHCGVMASNTGIFDRAHPIHVSGNYTQNELFDQIVLLSYQDQRFKQAQVEQNGDINIVYPALVQHISTDPDDAVYYQVALIRQTIGSVYHVSKYLNIDRVLARGAIGIKLIMENGQPRILRAYELDPL
jgi:enterochelin esterase-like enzyme